MISGYIVDSSDLFWQEKRLMKAFITAINICILLASTAWSESPEQHLKQQLKGKTVLIRGFFQDDRLEYNSAGEVLGTPQPGSWTVAKMQVKSIMVHTSDFEVRGPRLISFLDQSKGEFITLKPSRKHTIRVTVHASLLTLNQQQLGDLIQKLFVTDSRPDISVFPSYWREFLSGHVVKVQDKDGILAFRLRDQAAAEAQGDDQPVYTNSAGDPVFRVSKSVEQPRIVSQIDPEFSESARAQQFSGTTIVSLEVDKSGAVRDVQIVQPIGYGLDDEAVRAVKQWRFVPGRRKGEPVAVLVKAEVSFRLY
jgi:TonB family protein